MTAMATFLTLLRAVFAVGRDLRHVDIAAATLLLQPHGAEWRARTKTRTGAVTPNGGTWGMQGDCP